MLHEGDAVETSRSSEETNIAYIRNLHTGFKHGRGTIETITLSPIVEERNSLLGL